LGGAVKIFQSEEKKYLKSLIASVLIGLLVAILYYVLGLNLLDVKVSSTFNEFAVLGFSGLGALIGIKKN